MQEKFIDVKQLQGMLGISERTIFRLIKSGELSGFKVGREWRFTQADIDGYIERQRSKARGGRAQEGRNDTKEVA